MRNGRKIANHACVKERFFWNFIWRKATSRCSVSGIEMGLWIVTQNLIKEGNSQ